MQYQCFLDVGTSATNAIIGTKPHLPMFFNVMVFHDFWMVFQGIFIVLHGVWLVFVLVFKDFLDQCDVFGVC